MSGHLFQHAYTRVVTTGFKISKAIVECHWKVQCTVHTWKPLKPLVVQLAVAEKHTSLSRTSTALERLNDMPVVYRPVPVSNCSCKYVNNFYRATLPVSTVLAVGRCLSVTPVYCIQTAKDIVNLSYRPDSPIILVFEPIGVTQFQGAPFVEWVSEWVSE